MTPSYWIISLLESFVNVLQGAYPEIVKETEICENRCLNNFINIILLANISLKSISLETFIKMLVLFNPISSSNFLNTCHPTAGVPVFCFVYLSVCVRQYNQRIQTTNDKSPMIISRGVIVQFSSKKLCQTKNFVKQKHCQTINIVKQ